MKNKNNSGLTEPTREATVLRCEATQLKVGDKVSFDHYGETKTGTIAKLGKYLVFLTDGRWLHRQSVASNLNTQAPNEE